MITLMNHRRAIREFLNTYTEALLPHVVPRIFEIAVLSLKKDFKKINFSLEELDEIIYELREKDFLERQANLNLSKLAEEKMKGKICIAKHSKGLCNGKCIDPKNKYYEDYDKYNYQNYQNGMTMNNQMQPNFNENFNNENYDNYNNYNNTNPNISNGNPFLKKDLSAIEEEDRTPENYQNKNFYGEGYKVPKNRRMGNSKEKTLKNPNFDTLNKKIYPYWWWNEKNDAYGYSDEDSENEHRPGNMYDIAAKDITEKQRKIMEKHRFNDDQIFNYTMKKLYKPQDEVMAFPTIKSNGVNDGPNVPQPNNINNNNNESHEKKQSYKISFDKDMNVTSLNRGDSAPKDATRTKVSYVNGKLVREAEGVKRTPSRAPSRATSPSVTGKEFFKSQALNVKK